MSAPSNLNIPNCGASALASNLSTSFRVPCCRGHCGKVVQHALSGGDCFKMWAAMSPAHLLASLPIPIE